MGHILFVEYILKKELIWATYLEERVLGHILFVEYILKKELIWATFYSFLEERVDMGHI